MISDAKHERWCRMIDAGDSKYEFRLGITPDDGVRWAADPPCPNLKLRSVKEVQVRRFVSQSFVLTATTPEDADEADIIVDRLVAELEDGTEVEMARVARPADMQEIAEPDRCRACDGKIVDESEVVIIEGEPYHRRCTE